MNQKENIIIKIDQLSCEAFALQIKMLAKEDNMTLFDALLAYCETAELEVEAIYELIDPIFCETLKLDAIKSRRVLNIKNTPELF